MKSRDLCNPYLFNKPKYDPWALTKIASRGRRYTRHRSGDPMAPQEEVRDLILVEERIRSFVAPASPQVTFDVPVTITE